MVSKLIKEGFADLWSSGSGSYVLLGLLFFTIFIGPLFIGEGAVHIVVTEIGLLLILISGVFIVSCSKLCKIGTVVFVGIALFTSMLHVLMPSNAIAIANKILGIITLLVFVVLMIRRFLMEKSRLQLRIAAAIAMYLLIGVIWARLYEIAYLVNPAALSMVGHANHYTFIYFSFVTLVTLGYGDIVPVSLFARSLAMLEGIIGQLYLVILISSLVSQFSTLALAADKDKDSEI